MSLSLPLLPGQRYGVNMTYYIKHELGAQTLPRPPHTTTPFPTLNWILSLGLFFKAILLS